MEIDRQEIHSSILNFLELLENEESSTNIEALELELDRLALMYRFVGEISDDGNEGSEVTVRDYAGWRELLAKRFPSLGYYNIPSTISVSVGKAEIQTGDALDDLSDIANELSEFVWRWQNNGENDALWHLRFSYESHWGSHLRSLQIYLHALRTEK